MTLKMAQKIARANGMSIRKMPAGDYRVNVKNDPEIRACYEATIEDALDTAFLMWSNKKKGLQDYWIMHG